ncbi:zf-HC2 domain-containing protein [Streptomyces sp. NBC_01218]|uniref:anti-sigma factor family protein n=1 Tax=unclassified Streptomyces TaxID=2593676 RepID=UPI0023B98265|nr:MULTISPECIES: zf-HC2 domain-containing protein [unclassified Streptomyces]WEH39831.1 zf-HC2 domain-containing protein [Streptomyces sp. AM 2-1-1]WSQ51523.1 zf-HC2 domain-containing protein [Streptomyces sp. NBC_01218]
MTPTGPTPAEQHLGDRLAALVDGELKHDARERVLAHLATCARCKAEADAQRRVKSVFAQTASPSPTEGFLARLQGLPGGGTDDGARRGPFGPDGRPVDDFRLPAGRPQGDSRAERIPSPLEGFGYLPAAHGSATLLPGAGPAFRIHEVAREADRSPWRGRRFAFAAASAVSLAAIALGGAIPVDDAFDGPLRTEGAGSATTPLDADERAANGIAEASRRGPAGGALSVEDRSGVSATFTASSAPVGLTAANPPYRTGGGTEVLARTGQAYTRPAGKISLASLMCPSTASPLLAPLFPAAAAKPLVTASAAPGVPSPSATPTPLSALAPPPQTVR